MKRLTIIVLLTISIHCPANGQWVKIYSSSGQLIVIGKYLVNRTVNVWLSSDFGDTWLDGNNGLPSNDIGFIYCFGSRLFASGNYSTGFYSDDSGGSWNAVKTTPYAIGL